MKVKLSEKAKKVVAVVAPTLGSALGGPLGGLAGQILGALVGGGDPAAVEKAIIEQTPETLLALRKAEQEFTLRLEELGVERERIEMADRSSARELAKLDMRPHLWISGLFLVDYFGITVLRMTGVLELDAEDAQDMSALWGVLTTACR